MSPLSSFLVALSALFAVANAKANPYCENLLLGEESMDYVQFDITGSDGVVEIPDKCTRPGRKLIGELITVCNYYATKPNLHPLVSIKHPLSAVKVDCPRKPVDCIVLTLTVLQYCGMVTPPQPPGGAKALL